MTSNLKEFYLQRNRLLGRVPLKEMEKFLLHWQQHMEKNGSHTEWAAVTHELGLFYRGCRQYKKSADMFQKAGAVIGLDVGKNSPEYAALLNNLAGTLRQAGEPGKAAELFGEAIGICQQQKRLDLSACGSLYSNLAQTFQEMGEWEKAAAAQEKALDYFQLAGRNFELGPGWHNLALLYMRCGRTKDAEDAVEKALEQFRQHGKVKDSRFPAALNSLGGILYQQQNYDRAARVYDEAARYIEKFYGKNHDYAINRQHEAWALRGAGRLKDACTALAEAEKICTGIFGSQNEKVRAVHDELRQLRAVLKNREAAP